MNTWSTNDLVKNNSTRDILLFGYQSKASITSYLLIYDFKLFDSCIMHMIQMWFWVEAWVSCVLHSLVSCYIGESGRWESGVVLNMPKGLDGSPHGNVVDCSILADTRTWVLVFGTKTKRASTWGIHFPLGSSLPSLLRESHSLGFPFACEWTSFGENVGGYRDGSRVCRTWSGLSEVRLWSWSLQTSHMKVRLWPLAVTHGNRRSLGSVVTNPSVGTPRKSASVWRKDWLARVGSYTPCRVNLFEKPCPRLWTAWYLLSDDHRQHDPT